MAYEYESKLYANSVVHSITENVFIETGETKEIKEVYRKAKAIDEINKRLTENFKQEEPLYLADEYEHGLYNAYYEINGIIEEHLERD